MCRKFSRKVQTSEYNITCSSSTRVRSKSLLELSWRNTFLIMLHFLKPQRRFCTPQNLFDKANCMLFEENLTKIDWTTSHRLVLKLAMLRVVLLSESRKKCYQETRCTISFRKPWPWPQIHNYVVIAIRETNWTIWFAQKNFQAQNSFLETISRNSDNTMVHNSRSCSCIRSNSQIEIKLLNFNALLSHERVFLPKANINS